MNPSDDPRAEHSRSRQPQPPTPPSALPATHMGGEPGPWASTSMPDDPGAGAHKPDHLAGSGTCYLLHFERPYVSANGKGVARHYSGWAASSRSLESRLAHHEHGRGARLLQVVKAAGIRWKLARTWPGGRDRERQLKNQGGASRRCPECGVNPRSNPAERKDGTSMKEPQDHEPAATPQTSAPGDGIQAWASLQLKDGIQRLAAIPADPGQTGAGREDPQSRDLEPDLEAEP
jgi:hypothetical protein